MRKMAATLILLAIVAVQAGPNAGAGLYVDFVYTTPQIDSLTDPRGKSDLWIAITAQGVQNLDAFNVDVAIDTAVFAYRGYMKDNQMQGVGNLLEKNGGSALVFVAGTPDTNSISVTILGTLQGDDTAVAPEGNGLLALVHFSVKRQISSVISLGNADLKDPFSAADSISRLGRGLLVLSTRAVASRDHNAGYSYAGAKLRVRSVCDLMGRSLDRRDGRSLVQVRQNTYLSLR